MATPSLNLVLGRVLIAAAWSDGELTTEERTSLRDLLFRLPDLTVDDWQTLEAEIDTSVEADERTQRVAALHAAVGSAEERGLVRSAIEALTADDAALSAEDRDVLDGILNELDQESPSLLGRLSGVLRKPMQHRAKALANFFQKEQEFQDDVRRRIQHTVRARLAADGHESDLAPEEFHRLCLAGGILARVANVDDVITKGEYSEISDALQRGWDLTLSAAALVTEIAISEVASGLDGYALVREFFRHTSEPERIRFLGVLFRVAEADGHVSREEIEEIRIISKGFLLSHRHFIAAKTAVPAQRRDT